MRNKMEKLIHYKLSFYVPERDLERVKQSLFDVGAGKQGNYEHCCWQCLGQGQFKPLPGSHPTIGAVKTVSYVPEYKVEILCSSDCIDEAVKVLKKNHPYEEPAFEVVRLEDY